MGARLHRPSRAAPTQHEAGDVVGLRGRTGKFLDPPDDLLTQRLGRQAGGFPQDLLERRFRELVAGFVECFGDAVGKAEYRVAVAERYGVFLVGEAPSMTPSATPPVLGSGATRPAIPIR